MADRLPLRIVYVSGVPTIGEFQSGDTLGVNSGGTGVSSLNELADLLDAIPGGALSSLTDDVGIGFPFTDPVEGHALVWKGSNWQAGYQALSSLVDTTFTDLSANQIIVYDGTNWVNEYNDKTEMRVRNGTASAMSKGDVIAIEDAHNANLVNVILADASQTSAMPALGILDQDLAAGEEGIAITFGKAQGLNTSGLTEGATAYVSPTTPGSIVDTRPTADNHLVQNIGIVMRAHQSNGAIKVTGIGRANDIPNDVSSNIASNTSAIDNAAQLSDVSVELSSLVSSIHHGDLSGLGDNDHPQYTLSSVSTEKFQYLNGYTVMPQINSSYSGLTEWVEGSGAMTDWDEIQTTNASSNIREYAPDPFNGSSIVWKAYDDGPGDGSFFEGGFRGYTGVDLDTSKDHRFSVFVNQHDNFIGKLYMGLHVDSTPQYAVFYQNLGTWTNNPYFKTGWDNPEADEWYLCVGYANAAGTTSGTKNYGDVAGIYDMQGNRVDSAMEEFTFSSTAIKQSFRAFYYDDGDNDAAIGASFWHPRIDVLDGNEPSIRDLLKLHTTQHGQLDGLDQNDHPQYVLSSTNSGLSSTVTSKVNKELVGHYIEPWEEGSDSQNSPLGWLSNGVSSLREFDTDPFGNQSIIWKAIDTDVASDSEGGFNSGKVPADSSSLHRFSCFIKQENAASGNVYFGAYAYSSLDGGVYDNQVNIRPTNAASGTGTTNKYFIGNDPMPSSDWYLAVAYLLPYQTETGPVSRQDTALYKVSTGEKVSFSIYDFMLDDPTAIGLAIRAYHYNNPAGTGDAVQFFQPRIDVVDGNEPSIADLLRIVPRSDYVLSSTNSALSAQVDTNTSAIDNALDLSDIVTYIEHGDLNGLGDNDHPQYVLSSTNSGLSSVVDALGAFSYMQMTSDGTAGFAELNIGRGATQTVKEDGSTNIVWDSANNEFDVSATGTYHVLANLVLDVAATATIDLKIKKNTTAQNTFAAHGVHSAEDPEEVTMQCVFDATAGDTISVTYDELGSNNVTPKSGTNIMVRRLA